MLDLEPDSVEALRREKYDKYKERNVFAIGPILQFRSNKNKSVATSLWPESDCTQWLDKKPKGSVLYVSFGSWAHISRKDIAEIAHGISLSNVSFVWVLRPDIVSSVEYDVLPFGFREEVRDRSMIIPWCCQMTVLGHPAIGGFLTHCGWNSTLEGICAGLPMITWPLFAEQFYNEKFVVEILKIGVRVGAEKVVHLGEEEKYGILVKRERIKEAIEDLMKDGKEGDDRRQKAKELGEMAKKAATHAPRSSTLTTSGTLSRASSTTVGSCSRITEPSARSR